MFSMLGVIFFPRKELAAMAKVNPTMGDLYFNDLYDGMITWMSVFFGAVIWPNVTLPAMIEQNASYVLVFLFFALTSLIVWTNLLTAVVFQSYNERGEGDALVRGCRWMSLDVVGCRWSTCIHLYSAGCD